MRSRTLMKCLLAVAMATLVTACSSDDPAGPSGQTCRNVPAAYTSTSVVSGTTSTLTATCSFNQQTFQSVCNQSVVTGAVTTTSVLTTFYASISDVVAEVQVIPPLQRRQRSTTVINSQGTILSSETVYSYDAQNRLTRSVTTGVVNLTETYTAWDSAGRPTASSNASGVASTYLYNDSARTVTTTTTGNISTQTFDANGNLVASTSSSSGSTSTTVVSSTTSVCR